MRLARPSCGTLICTRSAAAGEVVGSAIGASCCRSELSAAKAWAGTRRRATPAVGAFGPDFPPWPGPVAPRRPIHFIRYAHFVQGPAGQSTMRAWRRAGPRTRSSAAPSTRADAHPPKPWRNARCVRVGSVRWISRQAVPARGDLRRRRGAERQGRRACKARFVNMLAAACSSAAVRRSAERVSPRDPGASTAAESGCKPDRRSRSPWRVPPAASAQDPR